jgi:aminoglycoside/choline kinase family phosphotransferase
MTIKILMDACLLMNQHDQQFFRWVSDFLPGDVIGEGPLTLEPLAGDAGFRRYFRLNTEPKLLAVDSPPKKERNEDYVSVSLALKRLGISRPRIYAVDYSRGFMLLEDLGTRQLYADLDENNVSQRYDQAEAILQTMQSAKTTELDFPFYDEASLTGEFDLFATWFVEKLLGCALQDGEKKLLRNLCSDLVSNALCQPQVLVHRDFHSRNLMILVNEQLAVIDFQDAVIGPVTYDLVSILRDCYVQWPEDMVLARVVQYRQRLEGRGVLQNTSDAIFIRWFELMGLQRHIKVLGIFARLSLRDNKPGYLTNLPLVIDYVLKAASSYQEIKEFDAWFKDRLVPSILKQPWYQNHQIRDSVL